jgi:hypothetical protein
MNHAFLLAKVLDIKYLASFPLIWYFLWLTDLRMGKDIEIIWPEGQTKGDGIMKIGELRALLNGYSEHQLRMIIAEIYKAIPKSVKEDKEIDSILTNPEDVVKPRAHSKKHEQLPDIGILREETTQFIEYAYQQYFLSPNSHVPKKERPKWRFTAKRLYRSLVALAVDEANLPLASELLTKLYTMLCYSCEYTLFSAYDTFESVGIEQTTFFENVLELKFRHESPPEFVRNAIKLIVDHSINRYTLYSDLMEITLHYLHNFDILELALNICNELMTETKAKPSKQKNSLSGIGDYRRTRKINNLVEMAFLCYGELQEFEQAIQYFGVNYIENTPEVKLYILLRFLFLFQQEELFIQEYQRALKEKVKPRETLVKLYERVQKTGEFPEFYA